MAIRKRHTKRIVKGVQHKLPDLVEGRVRCLCGNVVRVNPSGTLRRHKTLDGAECAHRTSYARVHLEVVPDVKIPAPGFKREDRVAEPAVKKVSRLDGGSNCRDCGKWLPGERIVCGSCQVDRNAERRHKT